MVGRGQRARLLSSLGSAAQFVACCDLLARAMLAHPMQDDQPTAARLDPVEIPADRTQHEVTVKLAPPPQAK
jgi:hypothetical protein